MSQQELLHKETTESIIHCFYHVYNSLGHGFLEKVYENSLSIALRKAGHRVEQQLPIDVHFEGEKVGEYFADLAVDNKLIVELKAVKEISPQHEAQLLNYLKATNTR